jgi:hypothetical protein
MRALAATCPDFKGCVCGGKSMPECLPFMTSAACKQDNTAVTACMRQSCSAQCGAPGRAGAQAATPSAQPANDADPCSALSACCTQMGASAPPSCAKVLGTNMPQVCTPMLQMFRNSGRCH